MRLEDLPVISAGSDLYVEITYKDRVDFPFLRWLKISCKRQGYLTPNMTGGTPLNLAISGEKAPGGGYSHIYYVPLEDVVDIRRVGKN
jgi:hypothetical protein